MNKLKHTILLLLVAFYYTTSYAQINLSEPSYISDYIFSTIDNDDITDSIYYHTPDSTIVFLLSSLNFQPLRLKYCMENDNSIRSLTAHKGGFAITTNHMRSWNSSTYTYEPDSKRFRFSGYYEENYGNAANDGSGTMSLDLIEGKFVGDWYYYDHEIDSLIGLPPVTVHVDNPPIYWEDDELSIVFPGYDLYESYKKEYAPEHTDTIVFIGFEYDYDYECLIGKTMDGGTYYQSVACNYEELYEGDLLEVTIGTHCYHEPGDNSYRAARRITDIKLIRPGRLRQFRDENQKQSSSVHQVDSLVSISKQKTQETDNQILYRTYLGYDGYTSTYQPEEWFFTLYFNVEGNLKKTRATYYKEDYESCWMYYNSAGNAIYTSYYACSMNGIYSIEQYLDTEGKLLYLNHISKEDEQHPTSAEHIVREQLIKRAGTCDSIPEIGFMFYDNISSSNDFKNTYLKFFTSGSTTLNGKIEKPKEAQAVQFIPPSKGDTTSLNQNDVFVYQKPTLNSRILDKLNIRRDIVIQGKKGEWYKITLMAPYGKRLKGYIRKDCVAPVERAIE